MADLMAGLMQLKTNYEALWEISEAAYEYIEALEARVEQVERERDAARQFSRAWKTKAKAQKAFWDDYRLDYD